MLFPPFIFLTDYGVRLMLSTNALTLKQRRFPLFVDMCANLGQT